MLFNEYTDILESGEVFFIDEENLYQLMMEQDDPTAKTPPNGLSDKDSSASSSEKAEAGSQQSNNGNEKVKNEGRSLFKWFKFQDINIVKWGGEQKNKVFTRIKEYADKLKQVPQDYNGEEEFEMPSEAPDATPRMDRSGGEDAEKVQGKLGAFKQRIQEWQERQQNKRKTVVKGIGAIVGAKWLIKQVTKMSGELDINLKEGRFHIGVGQRAAQQAAGGNGFAGSLAHVIKNVFLAILVLIGGIFKVIKEYLTALAKIVGTILGTIGSATKTLVTGEMPSKK